MLLESEARTLHEQISLLQRQRTKDNDRLTRHIQQGYDRTKEPKPARDLELQDGPADAGVATTLAEYEPNRGSGNGDDSHDSGSGRRTERAARECTYSDFLKCQSLNFKGTKDVIKFATCTLLGNALTWWNSHVKTVGHDAAYGMPWKTLKKMMTDNYCPRGEIKKLEIELWNLKVKGTDVLSYN
ncbi:putative reverse transcriptase domain-containing protein [Tanacetum coccineum]